MHFLLLLLVSTSRADSVSADPVYCVRFSAQIAASIKLGRKQLPFTPGMYRVQPSNLIQSGALVEAIQEVFRFDPSIHAFETNSYYLPQSAIQLAEKVSCPKYSLPPKNDRVESALKALESLGIGVGKAFPGACPVGTSPYVAQRSECVAIKGLVRALACQSPKGEWSKFELCDRGSDSIASMRVHFRFNDRCSKEEEHRASAQTFGADGSRLEIHCSNFTLDDGSMILSPDGPVSVAYMNAYELMLHLKHPDPHFPSTPGEFLSKWKKIYDDFERTSPRFHQMGRLTMRIYLEQKKTFLDENRVFKAAKDYDGPTVQ